MFSYQILLFFKYLQQVYGGITAVVRAEDNIIVTVAHPKDNTCAAGLTNDIRDMPIGHDFIYYTGSATKMATTASYKVAPSQGDAPSGFTIEKLSDTSLEFTLPDTTGGKNVFWACGRWRSDDDDFSIKHLYGPKYRGIIESGDMADAPAIIAGETLAASDSSATTTSETVAVDHSPTAELIPSMPAIPLTTTGNMCEEQFGNYKCPSGWLKDNLPETCAEETCTEFECCNIMGWLTEINVWQNFTSQNIIDPCNNVEIWNTPEMQTQGCLTRGTDENSGYALIVYDASIQKWVPRYFLLAYNEKIASALLNDGERGPSDSWNAIMIQATGEDTQFKNFVPRSDPFNGSIPYYEIMTSPDTLEVELLSQSIAESYSKDIRDYYQLPYDAISQVKQIEVVDWAYSELSENRCSLQDTITAGDKELTCAFTQTSKGYTLDVYYEMDVNESTITLAITCTGPKKDTWCATGISPSGQMIDSVAFFVTSEELPSNNNTMKYHQRAVKLDSYAPNDWKYWLGDDDFELKNLETKYIDGQYISILQFDIATLEKVAKTNISENINMIWGIGKMSDDDFQKHHDRGSFTLNFKDGHSSKEDGSDIWIRLHVVCMVLAFVVLMPIGILHAVKDGPGFKSGRRVFLIHQYIMATAVVVACFGFAIIIYKRNGNFFNRGLLITVHGSIGVLVIFGSLIAPAVGFLRPGKESARRRAWEIIHKSIGRLTGLLGFITGIIGAQAFVDLEGFEPLLIILLSFSCLGIVSWIILRTRQSCNKRKDNNELSQDYPSIIEVSNNVNNMGKKARDSEPQFSQMLRFQFSGQSLSGQL